MTDYKHGGERYKNNILLDFSVNTNPLGLPKGVNEVLKRETYVFEWYPDRDCMDLREAISRKYKKYGIHKNQILCGNGASELILFAVKALFLKKALVPVPSFFEYERALTLAGVETVFYPLQEEKGFRLTDDILSYLNHLHKSKEQKPDLLFICNPGNPSGNLAEPSFLDSLLHYCKKEKITVIADECFLELTGSFEKSTFLRYIREFPNLAVIHAFTKTYCMAGLRLGYMFSSDTDFLERCREKMPCWNVSGAAQIAGLAALQDEKYMQQSLELIARERQYLSEGLKSLGMKVIDGSANFLCFYSPAKLYDKLLKKGILIRDCRNFRGMEEGWYRICVRPHSENQKLLEAIRHILEKISDG